MIKNREKDKRSFIVSIILIVIGTVLEVLTVLGLAWSGFYFWGALLAVIGIGNIFMVRKFGAETCVNCPDCNEKIRVFPGVKLTQMCPACSSWLTGSTKLEVLSPDYIAKKPEFFTVLPKEFTWPGGCPVCGAEATKSIKIETAPPLMSSAVLPVSVYQKFTLTVPACKKHKDGISIQNSPVKKDEIKIYFRSYAYWKKFCELNNIPPAHSAIVTEDTDKK